MTSKRSLSLAALVLLPQVAAAQVPAIYDHGANALSRQLDRLQTTASVMHTGAHPDDEDSPLVAWHARGTNARTAYFSLTRGAGGQNLVGPEQAALLGVIRTEELLQARRLDGAQQFFSRAVDYGFSKYREEAARVWDEEILLGDMVRAIRQFRPDVVVSRWRGSRADGHGHHQFAGYLTPLAAAAAADPERFPEHFDDGLSPWRVKKLYTRAGLDAAEVLSIDTGVFDPMTGRTYFEIGMQGRSQQKTQSMGQIEFKGPQIYRLQPIHGAEGPETRVFDGLDTSIAGIAEHEDAADRTLVRALAELQGTLQRAHAAYDPRRPQELIPLLVRAHELLEGAAAAARSDDALRLLNEKRDELQAALALAAGLRVDALADVETIERGGTLRVAVRVYDPGQSDVVVQRAALDVPAGWRVEPVEAERLANELERRSDAPTEARYFDVTVPHDAKHTSPYWLTRARDGFLYDWSDAGGARNQPFAAESLRARVTVSVDGLTLTVERDVEHRELDRVRGELRRRVDVVPAVSLAPATNLIVVAQSDSEQLLDIPLTIQNHTQSTLDATLNVTAAGLGPATLPASSVELPPSPASVTVDLTASIRAGTPAGRYRLQPKVSAGGAEYRDTMHVVRYPHITTHRVYEPAEVAIEVVDLKVADVRVGYVMGSGDLVPDALRRMGVDVELLDDAALATGSLDQFDTIVVGIRASQARPAFVANNGRLLDFARGGGTLVVQYQQPDYATKRLAPFDARMEGSVRVVDETAPVTILAPTHPVFSYPNAIGPADFDGWVQERNNYNFTSYDTERFVPLTESHDPGEPPSTGAMLYARLGEGHFVYTSYSWFRQLPNGVPGAYRLFANLISLPAAPADAF